MPIEHYPLAPGLAVCRTLAGMWQASGAHGAIDSTAALQARGSDLLARIGDCDDEYHR